MRIKKYICIISMIVMAFAVSAAGQPVVLMMATTTSTDNTGLLDAMAPVFTADIGIELRWTATGTGKALLLGENCDVDILMVHAPDLEKAFVKAGFGLDRREIMYNDFIIIGPQADPAGIKGKSVAQALTLIREKQAAFISRGDKSGTHAKEISLWEGSDLPIPEKERWYLQTGQGMLTTINIAVERNGYTLTDRGTYIKYEADYGGKPVVKILVEADDLLKNQYSVITVNPQNCPRVKQEAAKIFTDWISGEKGQKFIQHFHLLGKPLFIPNAKQ